MSIPKERKRRRILMVERAKRELSQRAAADLIGIHPSTYSNIEKGTRNPSLETAIKIADFYNLNIKDI